MVTEVVWTESAKSRLREIIDFLSREAGVRRAKKIRDRIIARPKILLANPYVGQREEILADRGEGFRYLVEGSYKIVYFVADELIVVVTVFDTRRNPVVMRGEVPK